MVTPKSLPARPSLESLRKQAKRLTRDVAAGDSDALLRMRAHLPGAEPPLSLRDAQLIVARELGFPGWADLLEEVHRRTGNELEWAAAQAQRAIHDNDLEELKQLLAEHPALISWGGPSDGLLRFAVDAYGDAFDPERERNFTRRECAELLIDAGATVSPSALDSLLLSRARGMLQLFHRKGLLPRTPRFLAALGDLESLRAWFTEHPNEHDLALTSEAFVRACRFQHESAAAFLLDRCIALDPELGRQVDAWQGRAAFVRLFAAHDPLLFTSSEPAGLWQTSLMYRVMLAIQDDDLATFEDLLTHEPWMLGESYVQFQVGMIERATMHDRGPFIAKLLQSNPAMLRRNPRPQSKAVELALTYVKPNVLPLLVRVWPLPDDLPNAAGVGDFERVKRLLTNGARPTHAILDTALAYAVLNHHYEIAELLLAHGADIDTRWSSHEPSSILHELVFRDDYEAMQFLIDRGIDMTIRDYRWNATAEGWARYGASNPTMADWLAEAERRRDNQS
ncbi:MAG TPA: ankyrin repeat domain-containing protein [Gemmatimonadaceae bacterium]|nr:ankyrin repeat domain-containing protein [Gemmatimonadaceae bacterium]